MSLDITFNKKISFDEIETKTSLKVVFKNGNNFLQDEYGNVCLIEDNPTCGVTFYGSKNNPTKIIDELINNLEIKFIDDSYEEMFFYEPEKYKDINLWTVCMIRYGYLLDFDGNIIVPEREDESYKPYDPSQKKIENDNLPF